ncbi:hypothetical protein GCM10020295_80520 [Streptomyces cinereospinus]
MNASSVWHTPGHADRYRERVYAARERLAAEHKDMSGTQARVLADLLAFNADTEFGRRHGFARIRTMDDFRAAVPLQDYTAHAPLIERTAAGERGLLTADAPEAYFTSSGSTGAHKKVPVTPRFMSTTFMPFYFAAWAPLIEHFPEVLQRPDAVLNLKHDPLTAPPTTADGRPYAGASQVDFGARFGEPLSAEPGTGAPWAVLPVPTDPGDHLERAYLRLRLAVQSDLRCLIGINPAMIAAVPYQLNLWWPRIVKEVRDGTLGGLPHQAPDPRRADRLEQLAEYFGTVRPAHVWPRLRALFCWTTGVASLYLPALRAEFGNDVTVLPAPVAASEGPTGVALDRHASAGSLVASAAVYEFVPADHDLTPGSATLLPHEIEAGRDYHVVFSHVGGFYRYTVGDVVRVVDRVGAVPRVEYAGRGCAPTRRGSDCGTPRSYGPCTPLWAPADSACATWRAGSSRTPTTPAGTSSRSRPAAPGTSGRPPASPPIWTAPSPPSPPSTATPGAPAGWGGRRFGCWTARRSPVTGTRQSTRESGRPR